jgi:CP family cyanate transporter-like MFS transporter
MLVADAVRTARTTRFGYALIGILLIAVNLRVAFVSVGPLLIELSSDFGWSSTTAGLLTGLPLIAFAVFSPVAPGFARRLGLDRALWASLLLLAAGILARSVPVDGAIWGGTALLGVGIAFLNVLLPSLVKRDCPERISLVTGLYTAAQGAVAAMGAAVVVPAAHATASGWRLSLGIWAGLALIAMAVLAPWTRREATVAASARGTADRYRSPWKSAIGWQVTVFMGLQSMGFFILMTWLPSIENDQGVPQTVSGIHTSVFLFVGVLASLGAGALLHRCADQRLMALTASLLAFSAYLGLALAPQLSLLWSLIGALGGGTTLVIALAMFSLRTVHHDQAAALSGMAQSLGYAVAAAGPAAFGALYDRTEGWAVPLLATAGLMLVQCIMGVLAGRSRVIG